jgi:predicted nucleic acid binding AN1-type Zn finger protein
MKCNHLDCKRKIKLVEEIANKCKYCEKTFCYNHKMFIDHKCDKYKNNINDNNIILPDCNFEKIEKI